VLRVQNKTLNKFTCTPQKNKITGKFRISCNGNSIRNAFSLIVIADLICIMNILLILFEVQGKFVGVTSYYYRVEAFVYIYIYIFSAYLTTLSAD
jgi:hypothetical protein